MTTLLLVPTSGQEAAKDIAQYVVKVAVRLNADVEVLHILRDGETKADGERCVKVFLDAAEGTTLNIRSKITTGEVVATISSIAESDHANMILMGASRGKLVEDWLSADVMDHCEIPVLVVPHCYQATA